LLVATREERIRADELKLLVTSPVPLIGAAGTCVLSVVLLWLHIDHGLLLGWAAAMLVLTGVRVELWRRFRRIAQDDAAVLRWASALTAAVALSGALWGLFGIGFYLPSDVEIRGVALLILASMLASGTIFYSAYLPAHHAYVVGCALPIAGASFWHGSASSIVFGVVTFAYIAMILRAAEGFHRRIRLTIRTQHDNEALIAGLMAAKDAAEQANQTKTQFLATMSHELRTPLNVVIGYSEMLLEDAETAHHDEQIGDLRRINGAGQHLLALVNDVLDLAKIEAGRMELSVSRLDVLSFIDDILATCRPLVDAHGNQLDLIRMPNLGTITGDATKLRQVLLNLIGNAAKFTSRGKITVTVTRESDADGEWIVIAISDTGIGIEPDVIGKLFRNFTQAEASTAAEYGGTGLGLALSRRLCRLMGGEITVESESGRGSCFTMRVPAQLGMETERTEKRVHDSPSPVLRAS
jgi:signal transduction histidine kinase